MERWKETIEKEGLSRGGSVIAMFGSLKFYRLGFMGVVIVAFMIFLICSLFILGVAGAATYSWGNFKSEGSKIGDNVRNMAGESVSIGGEGGKDVERMINLWRTGERLSNLDKDMKQFIQIDIPALAMGKLMDSKWWAENGDATYDDYREEVKTLYKILQKMDMTWANYGDYLGGDVIKDVMKAVEIGIMAGWSYGHPLEPDYKLQRGNIKPMARLIYAFRVKKAKEREAVLKAYRDVVISQRMEVAFLQKEYEKFCSDVADGGNVNITSGKSPDVVGGCCGGTFYYDRILDGLSQSTSEVVSEFMKAKQVNCLSIASQIEITKQMLTTNELLLYLLSSNYSMLENQEYLYYKRINSAK